MKKSLITILAIFYLALSSGVLVNVHYCMGEFASIDYGHQAEEDCARCGMPDGDNACCKTDSQLVKLDDDHQANSIKFDFRHLDAVPSSTSNISDESSPIQGTPVSGRLYSPPDRSFHNIYLYNCVFRI